MTELGAVDAIAKNEDEIVPELLVAQRRQLQTEINSISNRIEAANQTLSPEQAEQLERLRETKDNLMTQVDKIDALLATENPDVLSEQAAGLPLAPKKLELYKIPIDPREFHEEDLPVVNLSDQEQWAEVAEQYEKDNGPEAEEALIADIDAKLLALIKESAVIVDEYERKRLELDKEKDEKLLKINSEKTKLMQDKKAYFTIKRQRDELIKRLQKDAEYN